MMNKKPTFKKSKKNKSPQQPPAKTENPKVLSLIGRLEKKTEKQMAGFVRELVRLKKQQIKLEHKLVKTKEHTVKTAQKKIVSATPKKKNVRKFKVVENKPRSENS